MGEHESLYGKGAGTSAHWQPIGEHKSLYGRGVKIPASWYGGGGADDDLKGLEDELVPGSGGYKGAVDLGGQGAASKRSRVPLPRFSFGSLWLSCPASMDSA